MATRVRARPDDGHIGVTLGDTEHCRPASEWVGIAQTILATARQMVGLDHAEAAPVTAATDKGIDVAAMARMSMQAAVDLHAYAAAQGWPPEVQAAALRTAAANIEHAVGAATLTAMVFNALNGKR